MSNYTKKYKILFFLISFVLLCKTELGFAESQQNTKSQDNGDVSVLRLDGHKITSSTKNTGSEDHKTFTDKIKILRVSEGEYDVFFENNGGPYSIPEKELTDEGTYHDVFQKAYADKSALQVTVDTDKELVLTIIKSSSQSKREPASTPDYVLPKGYESMNGLFEKHFKGPQN